MPSQRKLHARLCLDSVKHELVDTKFQNFLEELFFFFKLKKFFLAARRGIRDLSSLTRDQTHAPYIRSTAREVR